MNTQEVIDFQNKMDESLDKFLLEKGVIREKFAIKPIGYLSWLEEEFPKGEVPVEFVSKLRLIWNTGLTLCSLGLHTCEFCNNATGSSEKILIDKVNKIKYIFPELIFHYMEVHKFKPSDEFIDFIMKFDINDLHVPEFDSKNIGNILERNKINRAMKRRK